MLNQFSDAYASLGEDEFKDDDTLLVPVALFNNMD